MPSSLTYPLILQLIASFCAEHIEEAAYPQLVPIFPIPTGSLMLCHTLIYLLAVNDAGVCVCVCPFHVQPVVDFLGVVGGQTQVELLELLMD